MTDSTSSFLCPITHELMKDPVIDPDGNSYERSAIENWLRQHASSPIVSYTMKEKKKFFYCWIFRHAHRFLLMIFVQIVHYEPVLKNILNNNHHQIILFKQNPPVLLITNHLN
jgi:hypothetical protein